METVIRIDGLSKRYADGWGRKGNHVLLDLSMKVTAGQVLGVCGGNGSGKSTLLKILCGLLTDFEGEVVVGETKPAQAAHRGQIGFVPERPSFPSHYSPRRFLAFMGKLSDLEAGACKERIDPILQQVGLLDQADKKISTLSKGAVQRLSMAQALLHDPQVIIADEPMDGLDPLACQKTEQVFRSLADEGKTVLVATHLLDGLEELCDQLLVLHKGRSLFQGEPQFEEGLKQWLLSRLGSEVLSHG